MKRLPYVQFHPTALKYKIDGKVFLISEAVRGAGGKLCNSAQERFMLKVDQDQNLPVIL